MKSKITLLSLLSLSLIACFFWRSTQAQQRALPEAALQSEAQMLSQVLTELRQLRIAVQRSGQGVYRGQLMLEQLRTQQEKVARLTGQLEELRTQQAHFKSQQPQVQERLRNMETDISNEQNAMRRTQLEAETKAMRQYLEGMNQEEQQMQQREQQLTAQLLTEQATLNELNKQLKGIEQSLESFTASDYPAKGPRSR